MLRVTETIPPDGLALSAGTSPTAHRTRKRRLGLQSLRSCASVPPMRMPRSLPALMTWRSSPSPRSTGNGPGGGIALALLVAALAGCAHPAGNLAVAAARGLDGRSVALARPGKVVLVDFWATWCEPCKVALPLYRKLYLDLRERGFEVVAVSVDDGDEAVRSFLAREPLPFTVLRDPGGTLAESLAIVQMPTSFLLGRDGATRARLDGFEPGAEAALRKKVEALLDERGR